MINPDDNLDASFLVSPEAPQQVEIKEYLPDVESDVNSDDIQFWFRWTMENISIKSASLRCSWRDQGYGERKGKICVKTQEVLQSYSCGDTAPHKEEELTVELPDYLLGDCGIEVGYVVGGGRGHSLHIKNAILTLTYVKEVPALRHTVTDDEDTNDLYEEEDTDVWVFDACRTMQSFRRVEVNLFADFARFLPHDPRKIKRIIDLYRTARLVKGTMHLYSEDFSSGSDREVCIEKKTFSWVVLLEQWPTRMGWLLQTLNNNELHDNATEDGTVLIEFYKKAIECRVYTSLHHCSEHLQRSYHRILSSDGDPEVFEALLSQSRLHVRDIGGFQSHSKEHLSSYTFGLNPTLRQILADVEAHRLQQMQRHDLQANSNNQGSDIHDTAQDGVTVVSIDSNSKSVHLDRVYGISTDNSFFEESVAQIKVRKSGSPKGRPRTRRGADGGVDKDAVVEIHIGGQGGAFINGCHTSPTKPVKPRSTKPHMKCSQAHTMKDDQRRLQSYGAILAVLVHARAVVPTVFGLYSAWSPSSSLIMEEMEMVLKMLWLHQEIKRSIPKHLHYPMLAAAESQLTKIWQESSSSSSSSYSSSGGGQSGTGPSLSSGGSRKDIDSLYKWYKLGCPKYLMSTAASLDAGQVTQAWDNRQGDDFHAIEACLSAVGDIFRMCIFPFQALSSMSKQTCQRRRFDDMHYSIYTLLKGAKDIHGEQENTPASTGRDLIFDYEYIKWNAWLHVDSEKASLWVGLITEVYRAVERRYGPNFTNAQQKAAMYLVAGQVTIGLVTWVLGVVAVTRLYSMQDQQEVSAVEVLTITALFALSLMACVGVFTRLFFENRRSDQVGKEFCSAYAANNISGGMSKSGLKQKIKKELQYLCGSSAHESLPSVWTYLVPMSLGRFKPRVERWCARCFGGDVKLTTHQQSNLCKYVIFLEGLDRCQPEKVVEVLHAILFLTECTPLYMVLAIDPRIVTSAVEAIENKLFAEAGISGQEFLDRIINIPFAVPPLVPVEKATLCKQYLRSS